MIYKIYKSHVAVIVVFVISTTFLMLHNSYGQPVVNLVIDPDIRRINIGSDPREIAIITQVKEQNLRFLWRLDGPGEILGDTTSPGILYIAPETISNDSTQAIIQVQITDDQGNITTEDIIFTLQPPLPTPTSTPVQTVKLTVRSNVYDDSIFIDGQHYGSTRLDILMPAGSHTIRVEKSGYTSFEKRINLQQAQIIFANLSPLSHEAEQNTTLPTLQPQRQPDWDHKQQEMQQHFDKLTSFDKWSISSSVKIENWENFLKEFAEDNPYSQDDNLLRTMAEEQIAQLKLDEFVEIIQQDVRRVDYWLNKIPNKIDVEKELLTKQEIKQFNTLIKQRIVDYFSADDRTQNFLLIDLENYDFSQITRQTLWHRIKALAPQVFHPYIERELITFKETYQPSKYYFHNDKANTRFTHKEYQDIVDIMRLENLPGRLDNELISYAVVTNITDIRNVPSSQWARSIANDDFDMFQETQIDYNEVVAILHEGKNGFVFVQSSFYAGWVKKSDLAIIPSHKKDLAFSFTKDNFTVITTPETRIRFLDGGKADVRLGTKFPILEEMDMEYKVAVSICDERGEWAIQQGILHKAQATKGYLQYTLENILTQALRSYDNSIDYKWGVLDCSEYVRLNYKTFGIDIPRNTRQQQQCAGINFQIDKITATPKTVSQLIKQLPPGTFLGWPGHVCLLLGIDEGEPVVIHHVYSYKINTQKIRAKGIDIHALDKIHRPTTGESFLKSLEFVVVPLPWDVNYNAPGIQKTMDAFRYSF